MRKIIFAFIIISVLLFVAGCRAGGKAIAVVPGDPATQADVYLERAGSALDITSAAINEERPYQESLDTAGSYLVYADVAISRIPYEQKQARDTLRARYNSLKEDYDFLRSKA